MVPEQSSSGSQVPLCATISVVGTDTVSSGRAASVHYHWIYNSYSPYWRITQTSRTWRLRFSPLPAPPRHPPSSFSSLIFLLFLISVILISQIARISPKLLNSLLYIVLTATIYITPFGDKLQGIGKLLLTALVTFERRA